MSYQVIARKWRPQRFDDVVGQQAVTRTLRNALTSKRLAQAFVFAGPRGVGKTTIARILARALNCEKGPTAEPCGKCDACVEITEGRDIDVLEIDAATHTKVEEVREIIIGGLDIVPVRDRYKVFIIDEVHQLSGPSFNALLKSVEEPPKHVVFMMATTELEKIPETILSRSQVYEFRAIGSKLIAEQLRRIVDAEKISVGDESLQLIARDADGSMRDAQTKLDQVIAFTGSTIGPDDVSTVLGLVGRDLLLDAVQAVADETPAEAFALAGRAVEMGYDLRLVCRELSRVVRDLLVLSVDPSRVSDPEIAGEGERDRLLGLAKRFSREDLLRAFDLLTKAEFDIRGAAQPRYHLEMALLRWIYLRKLVSIEDLIAGAPTASPKDVGSGFSRSKTAPQSGSSRIPQTPSSQESGSSRIPQVASQPAQTAGSSRSTDGPKDALLAEIRKNKGVFYNTVVAQAQKIEMADDRATFVFAAGQRHLAQMVEQNRAWLEGIAQQVAGRKLAIATRVLDPVDAITPTAGNGTTAGEDKTPGAQTKTADKKALKEQAMADAGVQALLEVFPAEIRDVEEM